MGIGNNQQQQRGINCVRLGLPGKVAVIRSHQPVSGRQHLAALGFNLSTFPLEGSMCTIPLKVSFSGIRCSLLICYREPASKPARNKRIALYGSWINPQFAWLPGFSRYLASWLVAGMLAGLLAWLLDCLVAWLLGWLLGRWVTCFANHFANASC